MGNKRTVRGRSSPGGAVAVNQKSNSATSVNSKGLFQRISEFAGEVKTELGKVTWTAKEELQAYTKIVVGATFCCGLAIYFIDLTIRSALDGIAFLMRWLGA